jgi:hypothetical protein
MLEAREFFFEKVEFFELALGFLRVVPEGRFRGEGF